MTAACGLMEKNWPSVLLTPILVSPTGIITVSSTCRLRVKQLISFSKIGVESKTFQVKKVLSDTEFLVGDPGTSIGKIVTPTEYSGGSASVYEQQRNTIAEGYVIRSVYEEEPVIALRTIGVDCLGNHWGKDNPFPVEVVSGITKRIAIGFLDSDWVANQMVCIRDGVPIIPGQIGPHNMPLSSYLVAVVWRFIGPGYMKEVGLTVIHDPVTGNMTIIKAGLAPNFSGVVYIDGY